MKKNKFMRLASILLVACLMSTCCISGTFAKYVTSDKASDTARVAKWGVELQAIGNLYGDSYNDKIVLDSDSTVAVQSVDKSADVVAPGTEADAGGFTFSLKGKPEVAGKVTTTMKIQNIFLEDNTYGQMIPVDSGVVTQANFDEFTGLYWLDGTTYKPATAWAASTTYYTLEDEVTLTADYYPVVYALAGNTASTSSIAADSLAAAADKIAAQLGLTAGTAANDTSVTYTGTKTFAVNTDLASWKIDGETLTWAWAFEQSSNKDMFNGADTILGLLENSTEGTVVKKSGDNYIAPTEYTDYCLDTMFSIEITAEQTDAAPAA